MEVARAQDDGFAARLVDAHAQSDDAALVALVEAAGVAYAVRCLRRASCAEGPAIIATLVHQKPAWHRELLRTGAAELLVTAIRRPTHKQKYGEEGNERGVEPPQARKRQKMQRGGDDLACLVVALRCLSPMIETKLHRVVGAIALAYNRGGQETKRAALETLRTLTAKPPTKHMMLKDNVVALCVHALENLKDDESWQIVIDILVQLNMTIPPGMFFEAEYEADSEEESEEETEEDNSREANELVLEVLAGGQTERPGADEPKSLAEYFELAPESRVSKLKKLRQLITRNAIAKRAVGRLLPTFVRILTQGTESEQLAASRTIVAVIDRNKPNTLASIRAGAVDGFLCLLNTHSDVVSAVRAMELFVRRLGAIQSEETREALRLVFTELLGTAQDPSNEQGAVAIELACLLSTAHSLSTALVDAGAIRVCREALDTIMVTRTYSGAIQLRHVWTLVSNMARSSISCDEILEQGVLEKLLVLLKQAPAGSRSDITLALSQLATYAPAKTVIGSSGCLDILVHMLCSSVTHECTAAADALAAACGGCTPNVAQIRLEDVVGRCVEWLRAESEIQYEPALRLLAVLAADDESRPCIAKHNVSSLVGTALMRGSMKAKTYAANLVEGLVRDEASCDDLVSYGVQKLLGTVACDLGTHYAALAALRSLSEHSFSKWHPQKARWIQRVSRATGRVYACEFFAELTQCAAPASPEIGAFLMPNEVGNPASTIAQLRVAGGVRPLLKTLSSVDSSGTAREDIVDLLRQLANEQDESNLVVGGNMSVFSQLVCHGTRDEQTAAAKAIVEIFPATEWIQDEATRAAIVDACVYQFKTDSSSSLATKYATLVVTKLKRLNSIEADVTLAAFFHGMLTFVRANIDDRATLALRLLHPWLECPDLAHAAARAGVPAICVSVLEQSLALTTGPRSGSIELSHVEDMARAMIESGLGEKLVEEGALELLIAQFEMLHQRPVNAAGGSEGPNVPEMDSLEYMLIQQSTPWVIASDTALLKQFPPTVEFGKTWRTQVARTTDLLAQLAFNVPHTRKVIGQSTCVQTVVALLNHPTASRISFNRSHYVDLLAAACLDCPDNVFQVPHKTVGDICVDILKRGCDILESTAALRLIYSLASDVNAGPDIAAIHELVDAVLEALRKDCQTQCSDSAQWTAVRAITLLVRYGLSRTRLVEAGVEEILKAKARYGAIYRNAQKALKSLQYEQRKAEQLAREASERESEGFYLVDADDLIAIETDENLQSLIATIASAESPEERVTATKAVVAFIDCSGRRAVATVHAGLIDAMVSMLTTSEISDRVAKSTIQKCMHGLHNVRGRLDVLNDAEARIIRELFAFVRTNTSDRAKLTMHLLNSWATEPTFQSAFEASGILGDCLECLEAMIVSGLDSDNWKLKELVQLLAALVNFNGMQLQMAENGAAQLLLAVLSTQPRAERTQTLHVLHELVQYHAAVRPRLATHLDTVVTIMRSDTRTHASATAANVIAVACTQSSDSVQLVFNDELLELCVDMLVNGVSVTQQAALRLVQSLCTDQVAGHAVVAHLKLVEIVLKRRHRTPPLTRQLASDVAMMFAQLGVTCLQLDEKIPG